MCFGICSLKLNGGCRELNQLLFIFFLLFYSNAWMLFINTMGHSVCSIIQVNYEDFSSPKLCFSFHGYTTKKSKHLTKCINDHIFHVPRFPRLVFFCMPSLLVFFITHLSIHYLAVSFSLYPVLPPYSLI